MRRHHQPARFRSQNAGVALIAVLGLISLLMVLALGVLEATKRHGQMVLRSIQSAQAREIVDSALRLAILEWGTAEQQRTPDYSKHLDLFGTTVEVKLELESGRVDLNVAEESLLVAMFAANGYDLANAKRFATRVVDWRDADDSAGVDGGAERSEYRVAGLGHTPRNGPFESVSELRLVIGLEDISTDLLSAFTVYTHGHAIRESVAPEAVLRALRWLQRDDERVDAAAGVEDISVSLAGEVSRLRACAVVDVLSMCRQAIIRFTGSANTPALVYSWRTVT